MHFVTSTTTATPSANTLPCDTCTAHGPGFSFVVVAIAVALLFAYLLGRSHGKRSITEIFQGKRHKG